MKAGKALSALFRGLDLFLSAIDAGFGWLAKLGPSSWRAGYKRHVEEQGSVNVRDLKWCRTLARCFIASLYLPVFYFSIAPAKVKGIAPESLYQLGVWSSTMFFVWTSMGPSVKSLCLYPNTETAIRRAAFRAGLSTITAFSGLAAILACNPPAWALVTAVGVLPPLIVLTWIAFYRAQTELREKLCQEIMER